MIQNFQIWPDAAAQPYPGQVFNLHFAFRQLPVRDLGRVEGLDDINAALIWPDAAAQP